MSEWITHRLPTAGDAHCGRVAVAQKRERHSGVVLPGEDYRVDVWDGVTRGARWYPLNKEAADAAEAEQAAIAERAAAAVEPELKAKQRQLDDTCKLIEDLERELKRPGEWSPPAPESASPAPFSCGGCRWYSDSNSKTGLCCRHAPTHDGFPRVAVQDWCGDFNGNRTGTTTASRGTTQ